MKIIFNTLCFSNENFYSLCNLATIEHCTLFKDTWNNEQTNLLRTDHFFFFFAMYSFKGANPTDHLQIQGNK